MNIKKDFIETWSYAVLAIMAMGFVFMKAWAWVIIPIFSLSPLTLIQSCGLMAMIAVFIGTNTKTRDHKEKPFHENVIVLCFWFMMTLLIFYVLHLFI